MQRLQSKGNKVKTGIIINVAKYDHFGFEQADTDEILSSRAVAISDFYKIVIVPNRMQNSNFITICIEIGQIYIENVKNIYIIM